MVHQNSMLTIDAIGKQLGLTPQFLFEAGGRPRQHNTQFLICRNRAGGLRTICSPKNELKRLQRTILEEAALELCAATTCSWLRARGGQSFQMRNRT